MIEQEIRCKEQRRDACESRWELETGGDRTEASQSELEIIMKNVNARRCENIEEMWILIDLTNNCYMKRTRSSGSHKTAGKRNWQISGGWLLRAAWHAMSSENSQKTNEDFQKVEVFFIFQG